MIACEQTITIEGAIGVGILVLLAMLLGFFGGRGYEIADELDEERDS